MNKPRLNPEELTLQETKQSYSAVNSSRHFINYLLLATVRLGLVCHVITDGLDDGEIRSLCGAGSCPSHWIITINDKMNVWKYKLIYDTLQQKIEITDFKPSSFMH